MHGAHASRWACNAEGLGTWTLGWGQQHPQQRQTVILSGEVGAAEHRVYQRDISTQVSPSQGGVAPTGRNPALQWFRSFVRVSRPRSECNSRTAIGTLTGNKSTLPWLPFRRPSAKLRPGEADTVCPHWWYRFSVRSAQKAAVRSQTGCRLRW